MTMTLGEARATVVQITGAMDSADDNHFCHCAKDAIDSRVRLLERTKKEIDELRTALPILIDRAISDLKALK